MSKATENNNPGNIETSNDHWQGATGTNGVYVVFSSPAWGFRALYKDLYNNINSGNDTLYKIFYHYLDVPFSHSNQDAVDYANFVSTYLDNIDINDTIDPGEANLKSLAHGIAFYESQGNYFSETDYNNGYLLFKGEQVATSTGAFIAYIVLGYGIYKLIGKKKLNLK